MLLGFSVAFCDPILLAAVFGHSFLEMSSVFSLLPFLGLLCFIITDVYVLQYIFKHHFFNKISSILFYTFGIAVSASFFAFFAVHIIQYLWYYWCGSIYMAVIRDYSWADFFLGSIFLACYDLLKHAIIISALLLFFKKNIF
jgi:hypothetical protein